ncbi:MAG: TonB-dependent receptor, partial [Xanthomonadales bacterium]|nr:TonB-dependent receptor [Xanthomonadales bacterium]
YGSDFSPKIAARWQPIESLTLRASFGQGFRAPGLDILTQADSFSADFVSDPQTCLAQGLTADCRNASGRYSPPQVDTWYMANPDLTSEQSEQYSIGFIWSPLDWLDMSLDYYNIKVDDPISSLSAQNIVNRELNPSVYGPIPDGLSVTRNPTDGRIIEIITSYRNMGDLKTDGFDLRFNTDFDLGNAGSLRNMLVLSRVNSYEVTSGISDTIDYVGYMGSPKNRVSLQNFWSIGDFEISWNINYIDGQTDPDGVDAYGNPVPGDRVGGYATNDLQFGWNAPWNGKFVIGATNVGDRYPELVAYDGRPWNFYLYDAYGRTPYFRYTQTF